LWTARSPPRRANSVLAEPEFALIFDRDRIFRGEPILTAPEKALVNAR
jgi:hypothetical protein